MFLHISNSYLLVAVCTSGDPDGVAALDGRTAVVGGDAGEVPMNKKII